MNELRQAKKELALQREATRQEFGRQMKVVRQDVNSLILKRVVLPVGIGVVAGVIIKYFWSKNEGEQGTQEASSAGFKEERESEKEQSGSSWMSLISVGLSLLRLLQNMQQGAEDETEETTTREASEEYENSASVDEENELPPIAPKDFVAGYRQYVQGKAN